MPKFKSVLAACIALTAIGGLVACSAASAADGKRPNILPDEHSCLETRLVGTRT